MTFLLQAHWGLTGAWVKHMFTLCSFLISLIGDPAMTPPALNLKAHSPVSAPVWGGFARQSLFDDLEPQPIPGLTYLSDYITREEEAELLRRVDAGEWNTDLKRRVQVFGWAYDEETGVAEAASQGLPDWLKRHARRLREEGYFTLTPDRVSANEYQPGQGIGAHIDRGGAQVETVAIISLGAAVTMDFTRIGYETRSFYLRPRSLLLISGEARHRWMHGITPRKSDRVGGLTLPRGRRVSLMFRAVRPI
jgi:alkylated DNA repair dioxygenase AlkB